MHGYWAAKEKFGNPDVTWASLIQPSIDMAREGVEVGSTLAGALASVADYVAADPGLAAVFLDPETGETWREGDLYTNPALADTLQRIADNGPDELRSGDTAVMLAGDIAAAGGNMTLEDLESYEYPFCYQ